MWDNKTVEWVDVELTSFCNIKCPGCLRQIKQNKVSNILNKDILKFEDLKKWITLDELPNLKLLNFCGSIDEPTLHPEILDIVNHFNQICEINIASNGSTKTTNFWKELGSSGISVFFGIDGIDQQSLERYRVGSNYKKIEKNFKSFIKAGGQATWQFIVFEHNEKYLEDAKRISTEEGFKNFRTIYSHRVGNNESKTKQRKEEKYISCKYGNQKRIFLNHTGALIPCCFLNSESLELHSSKNVKSSFGQKYIEFGEILSNNLKYNSISEVLDGQLFDFVQKSWNTDPVEKCWQTCKKEKRDIFIDEELK